MRRFIVSLLLLGGFFTSFVPGQDKAKPHIVIPEAGDVANIKFVAQKTFPGGPFELSLTKSEEIKPLVGWLKDLGWDYAKSGDARVIRFVSTASITIAQKGKDDLQFIVTEHLIVVANRYWEIDSKKLDAVIKQIRAQRPEEKTAVR